MKMLGSYLPEIETISLYEVIPKKQFDKNEAWAVFDPCSAKGRPDMRNSIRDHAKAMGLSIEPLPVQENIQRCCGFGGQPEDADPAFVKTVREDRAKESDLPYLCYCMNCREAFLKERKPSAHILELRYADADGTPELSPTKRRANRELLKASLLNNSHRESHNTIIPDEVLARMDEDRIIAEDVYAVIDHMKSTKESVYHPKTGVHSGSLVIGKTTYWVDYMDDMTVINAYMHRMAVEHEEVWAGATKEQRRQASQTKTETSLRDGDLICERCDVEMKDIDAEFSYLGRSFRQKVKRCPACGLSYISEELARGRIRDVEMALEDK